MKRVLLNLGHFADGTEVVTLLKHRKDIDLCAITCTDNPEQYRKLLSISGGIGVYAGTDDSLLSPRTKENVKPVLSKRAWDVIFDVSEKDKTLTILNFGSLTNIAIALIRKPSIAGRIAKIIIVGGSAGSGDITPFAERGIYTDPLAAKIIFEYGIPILMAGIDSMKQMENLDLSEREKWISVAVLDNHYSSRSCFVGIETKSERTYGMTVCDIYRRSDHNLNADIITSYDLDKIEQAVRGTEIEK